VIGPLYLSSFNFGLVLVLFELVFRSFGLVFHPSFVFEGFLFLLLGPVFAKIFPILPWFQLLLLQDYIADAKCFVDYSIQFLTGVDQPEAKSCIFKNSKPDFKFSVGSPVWSPKMLTLESVRTEMTTSRGCESSCVFIEVVLLSVL
jgi:hypothetical protein